MSNHSRMQRYNISSEGFSPRALGFETIGHMGKSALIPDHSYHLHQQKPYWQLNQKEVTSNIICQHCSTPQSAEQSFKVVLIPTQRPNGLKGFQLDCGKPLAEDCGFRSKSDTLFEPLYSSAPKGFTARNGPIPSDLGGLLALKFESLKLKLRNDNKKSLRRKNRAVPSKDRDEGKEIYISLNRSHCYPSHIETGRITCDSRPVDSLVSYQQDYKLLY